MSYKELIKYLKNSIDEKGNYCYSLPIETTKTVIEYIKEQNDEIERLHSIIKEVRENINKKLNVNSDYVDYDFGTELLRQELLEILDKEKV